MSIFSTRKSKNQKNGPSGAPGPGSACPWRAKRGTFSEIVNIFVAVEGGPFGEKTNFQKKSHKAEKLKGGTLWGFSTSILTKKGGPFGEKIFRKKSRGAEKN